LQPLIRFDNVAMRYDGGPAVLRDINFAVAAGAFHFIVGPSGAGKSSLLRLITLAHHPFRGRITLFGRNVVDLSRRQLPALRRRIGVVFQDFRLIDHLSVRDNVALPLRIAAAEEQSVRPQVEELLHWVGLGDKLEARPSTLSGGEQQRVAIARAVIARPELLVADEPTGNVDERIGSRLIRLFEELNRFGTTVIIATHSESLVRRFDHRVMSMENGWLDPYPSVASRIA
jgi:cell division transport system ATP-binding protein